MNHARVLIRPRHIRACRQIINIPSFLVRTDSEKHIGSTLTRRPRTVMMHETEEESFQQSESRPGAGGHEKEIPA